LQRLVSLRAQTGQTGEGGPLAGFFAGTGEFGGSQSTDSRLVNWLSLVLGVPSRAYGLIRP